MTNNQVFETRQKSGHAFYCCSCISWSAIFSGAFVAIGLSFLLSAFASSIGLSAFSVGSDNAVTLALGGYLGLLIGSIIIMFCSGWVAGYLNRHNDSYDGEDKIGALSGFIAWCLALILGGLLAAQFGHVLAVSQSPTAKTSSATTLGSSIYNQMATGNTVSTKEGNASARTHENKPATVDEKAANTYGKALFLTFVLFFAGALSSTIGGYWGVRSCYRCKEKESLR